MANSGAPPVSVVGLGAGEDREISGDPAPRGVDDVSQQNSSNSNTNTEEIRFGQRIDPQRRWEQGCPRKYLSVEGCGWKGKCPFLHDLNAHEVSMLQIMHRNNLHVLFTPSHSSSSSLSQQDHSSDVDSHSQAQSRMDQWAWPQHMETAGVDRQMHDSGKCRPCFYFLRAEGCSDGAKCMFCHFEHDPAERAALKSKVRPSKGKRDRQRKVAERLSKELQANPHLDLNSFELPKFITKNEGVKKSFVDRVIQDATDQARPSGLAAAASSAAAPAAAAGDFRATKHIVSL